MNVWGMVNRVLELPITEGLGWTLLHFAWQGVAVALLLAVVLAALKSSSARVRYFVACTALVLMAILPILTFTILPSPIRDIEYMEKGSTRIELSSSGVSQSLPIPDPHVGPVSVNDGSFAEKSQLARPQSTSSSPTLIDTAVAEPTSNANVDATFYWLNMKGLLRTWLPAFVLFWLCGVVVLSARLLWGWREAQRYRKQQTFPVPDSFARSLERVSRQIGVQSSVELIQSALVEVPTVIGWLRPVVLLPIAATVGLTSNQLEAILAHELAHIKRGDYLVNLVQCVVETLLFYQPAVWWVSTRIRVERENCCDDIASEICGDPVSYATALVRMEELRCLPKSVALTARGGDLKARVKRLISAPNTSRDSSWFLSGAMTMAVVFGMLGTLWFASTNEAAPHIAASEDDDKANAVDLNVTAEELLQQIEAAISGMESAEYEATFAETRNANAFTPDKPLLVKGNGSTVFRTDGKRWIADERGFTIRVGTPNVSPQHQISGFDGEQYFSSTGNRVEFGENQSSQKRLNPSALFWHGARSVDWLLRSIKSHTAKIDRRETIDGEPCVVVLADPTAPKPEGATPAGERQVWESEIAFAPRRGWLPIRTRISLDGKPYAVETLRDLKSTDKGVWYPTTIRFESFQPGEMVTLRETRITSFRTRDKFEDADFRFIVPFGTDIVDQRSGLVWHNDPWWTEMSTWLGSYYTWPPIDTSYLRELQSYADEKIDFQPAPELLAREWNVGKPKAWDDPQRGATVVFFFGGDAISPTPRWLTQLKGLHELYSSVGLDVIAIASSEADPAIVNRTIKALGITFPVAIDQPGKDKQSHGRTHEAFGLKTYMGAVIVDHAGQMRYVGDRVAGAGPADRSRIEQVVIESLGDDAQSAIRKIQRERLARRLAFDVTGRPADPTSLLVAVNNPKENWLEAYGERLFENLPAEEKEKLTAKRFSVSSMIQDLLGSPLGLTTATLHRLEREWERRRQEQPSAGTLTGQVLVTSAGRSTFGELKSEGLALSGTPAKVRLVPEFRLLLSTTPGGHFLAIDHERTVTVECDSTGKFTVPELPKGTYRATIDAPGLALDERTIYVSQDDATPQFQIVLHQGRSLSGQVVDSAGKSIANANVKVAQRHFDPRSPKLYTTAHVPNIPSITDADGRFIFDGLYVGAYTFEIAADGYSPRTIEQVPAGRDNVRVVLRRPDEVELAADRITNAAKTHFRYACDVTDADSGKPIAGTKISWHIDRMNASRQAEVVWRHEAVADANGQYEVELSIESISQFLPPTVGVTGMRDSVNSFLTLWVEAEHRDYLPIRGSGYPFFRPQDDAGIQLDHRHLKLRKGVEVTGQLVLPNGSPAKNVPIMVATNRDGFGDGDGRGSYGITDDDGRFRVVTRPGWPQRIHWFPDDFASDSKATTKTFGDQGVIRLKPGYRMAGRVEDSQGKPLAGITVRATSGTTIPIRYTTSNDEGEFEFPPLPVGEYFLFPVDNYYLDHRSGDSHNMRLPMPFKGVALKLTTDPNAPRAILRASETIEVLARVLDGRGEPVLGRRLIAGEYPDVVFSQPMQDQPGSYKLILPKGQFRNPIRLEHHWDEAALYQLGQSGKKAPGDGVLLKSAESNVDDLTIHVVPSGTIHFSMRTESGEPLPKDRSFNFRYANEEEHRAAQVITGGFVASTTNSPSPKHSLLGIAPGEPVIFKFSAAGFEPIERRVTVQAGQTETIEVVFK